MFVLGKQQKCIMAMPLGPYPPPPPLLPPLFPPSSLMPVGFFFNKKKIQRKVFFWLMASPLPPTPFLMALPLGNKFFLFSLTN